MTAMHPDDEFHPPTSDDPDWLETSWFAFSVPERRLCGWLYPLFRPNLGVFGGGVYLWDDRGDDPRSCLFAKTFWHLPLPAAPLSNLELSNGMRQRCVEPLRRYELSYRDPDDDELRVDLAFTAVMEPYRFHTHIDQAGRFEGTIVCRGERIGVDGLGIRDRSWGVRSQRGPLIDYAGYRSEANGYSHATASDRDGFQAINADFGDGKPVTISGYLLRDGITSRLASGRREVLARDPGTGCPTRVRVEGIDEMGRELHAEGRTCNRFGAFVNPNLWTWATLVDWTFDGVRAWGEDHDNYSAAAARRFHRKFLGHDAC